MRPDACIVIGGGLAGAAFALELARNGVCVLILEKTRAPHHKVCGEFLSEEAQSLITYLGLDVWTLGAAPVSHLRLVSGEDSAVASLPFCGAGLSRFRLDEALLVAATQAGAQIVRGATVTRLEPSRGSLIVYTSEHNFRAAHVALATGKHDLRGLPRPKGADVAFKMQMRVTASAAMLQDLVQLMLFPGGYMGACLVEDGLLTICWVMKQELLKQTGADWCAQCAYLSQQSSHIGELLSCAEPVWQKPVSVAAIPYGFLRREVISPDVYPLGDQLAVIPSYTGDGTSIALHSGIAAAQAVLEGRPAGEFQTIMVSQLRPQLAWAKVVNLAFTNAVAQRMSVAVARSLPWVLPGFVSFIARTTRIKGFRPVERTSHANICL